MSAELYPTHRECAVDTVKILDLDRHILDTELFHVFMREAAWEEAGIATEDLNRIKTEKEKDGRTFHADEIIREILADRYKDAASDGNIPEKTPDEQINAVFAWMLELCEDPAIRDALFLPGAKKFVDDLKNSGAFQNGEALFLTWGTRPLQMLKLMCTGLNAHPYMVTDQRAKGEYIANGRNSDGKYEFFMMNAWHITAKNVELYDDKASSFKGLPSEDEGVRGFWMQYQPEDELLPSQKGSVPYNVEIIHTFPKVYDLGSLAINNVDKV